MQNHSDRFNQPTGSTQSTKEKIFHAALELFGMNGYEKVSVRDIAKSASVKVPTIYNHFESKEAILKSLYDFYIVQWQETVPDINELLYLAETEPPHDVLIKLDFRFDPSLQRIMDRIIGIAIREIHYEMTKMFVKEHMTGGLKLIKPLLEHMLAHKRIEPLNIDAFLDVITNHALCAAMFCNTPFEMGEDRWRESLELVFSLIKPTSVKEK